MDKEFDIDDSTDVIENDPLDSGRSNDRGDDTAKPERKLSIREALSEAVNKSRGDDKDIEEVETSKKPIKKKDDAEDLEDEDDKGEETPNKAAKTSEKKTASEKSDNSDENDAEKTPKPVTDQSKAPTGWTKEAKEKWDSLPAEVKSAIAKREKEVSDGFRQYGEKAQDLQKYETLIGQYGADYQQYGFSHPSQLVERAFQWVHALRNPNRAVAVNSFKQLAQSLGIENELVKIYGGARTSANPRTRDDFDEPIEETQTTQQVQYQTDPSLVQAVQNIQQQFATTQQQQAEAFVSNWATNKPHFERVRKNMYALLSSGAIPPKNGQFDLDEAYNRAVRMDPELYEEELNSRLEAERETQKKKAAEKAAKQKEAADRARKANISLRPNAPTSPMQSKPDNKKLSVRDTIRNAVRETSR